MVLLTGPTGALELLLADVGAAVVVLGALIAPGLARWWLSKRTRTIGRAVLAGRALIALPGSVAAIDGILP